MRCWLIQQLEEQMNPTYEIYKDFDFSFQLIMLSGDLLMDRYQPDKQAAVLIPTAWGESLNVVWDRINYHSAFRFRQFVVKDSVVTPVTKQHFRWHHIISREDARPEGGFLQITIALGA